MVVHSRGQVNAYGDAALKIKRCYPRTTPGNAFNDTPQYDYWDHVDYIIDKAEEKGLRMALVPVWGSNVKRRLVTQEQHAFIPHCWQRRRKSKP